MEVMAAILLGTNRKDHVVFEKLKKFPQAKTKTIQNKITLERDGLNDGTVETLLDKVKPDLNVCTKKKLIFRRI